MSSNTPQTATGTRPKIVQVAVPCPLRRLFDYRLDPGQNLPAPGCRVLVPFGPRQLLGVIIQHSDSSDTPANKLRAIDTVLDEAPVLNGEILALVQWMATYYHHPIGDCVQQALPLRLRSAKAKAEEAIELWQRIDEVEVNISARAAQQHKVAALFQQQPRWTRAALSKEGVSWPAVYALEEKGLLQRSQLSEAQWLANTDTHSNTSPTEGLQLNDEQSHALKTVSASFGCFDSHLLEGVTGSGKTEVYLQLIQECLDRGEQTLVLIPEIGLTPQTLSRFQQRFGEQVYALHSELSEGERYRAWQGAKHGRAKVVLGTRSAIFTPFKNLGLIIVDEEHDGSYKQQDSVRYHARDMAVKRAADNSCPILLGTATPSLESLYNALSGRYQHLHMRRRAGSAKAPHIRLLDIRQHRMHEGISESAIAAIKERLARNEQVLVFLNRRGFSPTLQCHSCGWLAECRHCDAKLTVHRGRNQLRCHHCDYRQQLPSHCPDCQHPELEYQGPGTERLEAALNAQFQQHDVIRIDRDSTSTKAGMAQQLARVHEGKPCILVGTQMLAKGHHLPKVTLVLVLDSDAGFFSADYRAAERAAQLLVQVAGRAGRAELSGEVWVQTHYPEHPMLRKLCEQGYASFAESELQARRSQGLPPYQYSAVLRADAPQLHIAEDFLGKLRRQVTAVSGCQMIGPLPAPMTRKAGRYRAGLILQSNTRRPLHQQLRQLEALAEQQKGASSLRWGVDVDPIEGF